MKNINKKMRNLLAVSKTQVDDLLNDCFETINDIDWDKTFNDLSDKFQNVLEKGKAFRDECLALMNEATESLTDFEVTMPFDESIGEKFEHSLADGKLTMEVSYDDGVTSYTNRKTVTVPSNCDVSEVKVLVDASAKTVKIVVPRAVMDITDDSHQDFSSGVDDSADSRNGIIEDIAGTISSAAEQTVHISDELGEKLKRNLDNARRYARGANGRFVRRTV